MARLQQSVAKTLVKSRDMAKSILSEPSLCSGPRLWEPAWADGFDKAKRLAMSRASVAGWGPQAAECVSIGLERFELGQAKHRQA